ncbi:proteasome subunit beta type-7 isoform X2 [Drosophila rhopaloa]|nr:proteasome subunit beta type-7 isoform X2 [Drosophila rhopaloa]
MDVTRAQLELHRMNTGFRTMPVCCANQLVRQLLFRFNGNMKSNVIIGGVDPDYGSQLFCTRFDGTTNSVQFTSLGSGNMPAMAVLDSRWTADLDEESARDLVCDAVTVGVDNDLNSGSKVCLCIIRSDFSVHREELDLAKSTPVRGFPLVMKPGCTAILSTIEHRVVPWGEAPVRDGPGSNRGGGGEKENRRREHENHGPPKSKKRRME